MTDIERLFSDSSLLVPSRLHECVLRGGFRPERQAAIYLIYDVIAQKCSRMKAKWTRISDKSFGNVVKNHTRKSAEKKWLEENGFIEIKKWRSPDGTLKNSKIPGKQCQAYRLIEQECECIWVNLWRRELVWPTFTEGDQMCQYTRHVLNQIELDQAQIAAMCLGECDHSRLSPARKMAILHWARVLELGTGSVRRGRRVNRLYSPWTSAPRELRKACQLIGEAIATFDLQASQPTLIGVLAEDDAFSNACLSDELYGGICKLFGINRDEAKPTFLSYIYGRNRTPKARNKRAFLVQQYVEEHFPKTHAYIWQRKQADHTQFACHLQNLEAELFVNALLATMKQKGIPALTVHDCLAVPESRLEEALEIAREILKPRLGGKAKLRLSHGGKEEQSIAI